MGHKSQQKTHTHKNRFLLLAAKTVNGVWATYICIHCHLLNHVFIFVFVAVTVLHVLRYELSLAIDHNGNCSAPETKSWGHLYAVAHSPLSMSYIYKLHGIWYIIVIITSFIKIWTLFLYENNFLASNQYLISEISYILHYIHCLGCLFQ